MSGPARRRVRAPAPAGRAQRGIGLIEVLVALVVVSLGVLGIAGMQMTGMQHGSGSLNRTVALTFAEDMAERMRVNAVGGRADDGYDDFDSTARPGLCDAPAAPYCDAGEACEPDELAAFDLASVACGSWADGEPGRGVVNGALPGGTLAVDCLDAPCTGESTWAVTVGWTEGATAAEADETLDRSVTMRLRP